MTAQPWAIDIFRRGQRVRCVQDGRRGVVRGFTPHPGGLVVGVFGPDQSKWDGHGYDDGRLTISHMALWRPA